MLLVGFVAGCGGPSAPTSSLTGVVVAVRSGAGLEVEAFSVRTPEGTTLEFQVGPLDLHSGGFPASHLREHQATSEPVRVFFRREGPMLVATRLEDA